MVDNESGEEKEEPTRAWVKKVELPTSKGDDPLGWIARAEKFFEEQQVRASEKLHLAFNCIEGNVVHWFQFWKQKAKNPSREDFLHALLRRYGENSKGTIFERLASIKRGSVDEYVQEFEIFLDIFLEV